MSSRGSDIINTGENSKIEFKVGEDKKIQLDAAYNTNWTSTTQGSNTEKANFETNLIGYAKATASYDKSNSDSTQTSKTAQFNTILNMDGTTSYAGGTLEGNGVNSYAKIQDLTQVSHIDLSSAQDTSTQTDHSSSAGGSLTIDLTSGGPSAEVHGSTSAGSGSSAWTNSRSSIVGTEKVDIVADSLKLKGASIYQATYSQDEAGKVTETQGNNLNLKVNTLVLEENNDSNNYAKDGSSGGLSLSGSGPNVTVGISQSGYTKEGVNRSYIGQGTLDYGSLDGTLNQDASKVQEITKDDQRAGINFSVDTDTLKKGADMFDDKKRDDMIGQELHDLSGLTLGGEVVSRVGTAAGDAANVVGGTITGKIDLGQAVDVLANSKIGSLRDLQEEKARDEAKAKAKVVNNLVSDGQPASGVQNVLKGEVEGATTLLGGSNTNTDGTERQTLVYDKVSEQNAIKNTPKEGHVNVNTDVSAFTDTKTKDVAFNLTDPSLQNGSKVEDTTIHEAAHRAGYGEGMATLMGNVASSVWTEQNTKYDRTTGADTSSPAAQQTQQAWVAQQHADPVQNSVVFAGNQMAEGAGEIDPKLYVHNQKIIGTDVVDDKKVEIVTDKKYPQFTMGAELSFGSKENPGVELKYADQENKILKIKEGYSTGGKEYDLDNSSDFEALRKTTDMTYITKGEEVIYYQNGIQNSEVDAKIGAARIKRS